MVKDAGKEVIKISEIMDYLADKYSHPSERIRNTYNFLVSIDDEISLKIIDGDVTKVEFIANSTDNGVIHFRSRINRVSAEEYKGYVIIIRERSYRKEFYIISSIDPDNHKDYLKFQALKNI